MDKILITIDNEGKEITHIKTDGYVLLYLQGDKVKCSMDLELKALAPHLMKYAMEKMAK